MDIQKTNKVIIFSFTFLFLIGLGSVGKKKERKKLPKKLCHLTREEKITPSPPTPLKIKSVPSALGHSSKCQ